MSECIHHLDICSDCGGLQVTQYTELSGVTGIKFGPDEGETQMTPTGTRLFWSPGPTPCGPESEGD